MQTSLTRFKAFFRLAERVRRYPHYNPLRQVMLLENDQLNPANLTSEQEEAKAAHFERKNQERESQGFQPFQNGTGKVAVTRINRRGTVDVLSVDETTYDTMIASKELEVEHNGKTVDFRNVGAVNAAVLLEATGSKEALQQAGVEVYSTHTKPNFEPSSYLLFPVKGKGDANQMPNDSILCAAWFNMYKANSSRQPPNSSKAVSASFLLNGTKIPVQLDLLPVN